MFEFANLLFICYLLFGGMCFSFLEGWDFAKSTEFCLMTLMTIGYGNITPTTFWGRIVMMVYTSAGLVLVGFYVLSQEDVLYQDTDLGLRTGI